MDEDQLRSFKERPIFYVLRDKVPVPATSWESAEFFEVFENRLVARTEIDTGSGKVMVSTVFLCMDHSLPDEDEPSLFETAAVGGPFGDEFSVFGRSSTWNEAVSEHDRVVRAVRFSWELVT